MVLEFRQGGRRVSQKRFLDGIKEKALDQAINAMEEKYRGVASAIVDPATGKHAEVFVRRANAKDLAISTSGSPAFAREFERRLGLREGEVEAQSMELRGTPRVYLAHASEDHNSLARPLAERLIDMGVEVWLDEWEIQSGDSLKQRMEEGLAASTHFVVLLTPNSIGKPWVEREIDVGFVRLVNGQSRFMGLRIGVNVSDLSPFLQTLRCPAVRLESQAEVEGLVADIFGVSSKPPLGEKPRYVDSKPQGLSAWSDAAATVASHLVRNSSTGRSTDPEVTFAQTAEATGLPLREVRLAVLDLVEAGLVERDDVIGSDSFWPERGLFVEFDRYFMEFNNRDDAISIANLLVSEHVETMEIRDLAARFSGWMPRRLNSALSYLQDIKAVKTDKYADGGPWVASELEVTDRTFRFVRDHG